MTWVFGELGFGEMGFGEVRHNRVIDLSTSAIPAISFNARNSEFNTICTFIT